MSAKTVCERIAHIDIEGGGIVRYGPEIEAERRKAVEALIAGNRFQLVDQATLAGPYHVHLCHREEHLIFEIRNEGQAATQSPPVKVSLNLTPLRRTIRDYCTVCQSYFEAASLINHDKLEVIDAGCEALHNEGAQLLRDHLKGKIDVNHETARGLFTLVCVMHIRG